MMFPEMTAITETITEASIGTVIAGTIAETAIQEIIIGITAIGMITVVATIETSM